MTVTEKSKLKEENQAKDTMIQNASPADAKLTEERYQEFIQEKLGKLEFSVGPDEITVDHKIRVCGEEIDVHVLDLEITGQDGLITPEFLEVLQRSPEERRAMAQRKVLAARKHTKILWKKRARRQDRRCRGSQLKTAYRGDAMTEDSIKQLQRELRTKTREEVWAQITYITKTPKHGKAGQLKKSLAKKGCRKKNGGRRLPVSWRRSRMVRRSTRSRTRMTRPWRRRRSLRSGK